MKKLWILLSSVLLMSCEKTEYRSSEFVVDNELVEKANNLYEVETLISSLNSIKDFHGKNSTSLKLNPPASDADLDHIESVMGCKLPEELKTLWSWHNGESSNNFIWYHRFLPVSESVQHYQELTSSSWSSWPKNWIPVFEFEGEWYGVECSKVTRKASPVIFYFVEDGEKIAYLNITRYMQFISQALEADALRIKNDWWEDDITRMAKIHAALNEGILFPYAVD